MNTYVATSNAGKLAEMQAIFDGSELALVTYPAYRAIEEGEQSYGDNALAKARALSAVLEADGISGWVVADDSGLEVDALDGRPGVLSARYGGECLSWAERRAALQRELQGVPPERRSARFVAYLALVRPGHADIVAAGTVDGFISSTDLGVHGFGYDPIFIHPPSGVTFAEMTQAQKNRLSHRRRAADLLLEILRTDV